MDKTPIEYVYQENKEKEFINQNFYIEQEIETNNEIKNNIYKQFIEIKRSIKEDLFFIKIRVFSLKDINWKTEIQINNKKIQPIFINKIKANEPKDLILPFTLFEKEKFSTIKSIVIVSNFFKDEINDKIIAKLKINSLNLNKNDYFINSNNIHFKTIKALRTSAISPKLSWNNSYNKTIYNNVIFYPQKLEIGKHNQIIYKIVAYNDFFDYEMLERDIDIEAHNLINLPILNNEKLNVKFIKSNNLEMIDNKKVIGYIEIQDETYYDFKQENTIKGTGPNSQKGYFIPYNFAGSLKPILNIKINNDYKNIQISHEQKIKKKFLDVNDGIVDLKIISYKNSIFDDTTIWYKIKNEDFRFIQNENLTLEGLKNLYKKDEDEEDQGKDSETE